MTPEEVKELKEIIEAFKKADLFSGIMIAIILVALCIFAISEIYRLKKIKKLHREWKSTLTEEQLKTIKKNNEYFK